MGWNKWLNKQKPITLGFIIAITSFIICYFMSFYTEIFIEQLIIFKFCGSVSTLTFFISWGLFYIEEKSSAIFDEIDKLYISAKKVKTKGQLIITESDYRLLRKKCQHKNHYSKMNEIWQILQTKKEYL